MSELKKSSASETLAQILLGRLDDPVRSEREQALLRLGILSATFFYLVFLAFDSRSIDQWGAGFAFVAIVSTIALGILVSTYLWPRASKLRRVFSATMDLFGFSLALIITEDAGAPWFGIYLWVIFGNTLRYGMPYLYLSTALAVTGFVGVLLVSDYWRTHPSLGLGLLVTLVVLPAYAAALAQRLRNAQLAAESANQAKSQFLANMSHEIRTPLNGIIGAAELLKERELPNEDKRFVEIINHSGATLLQLINNILDLSKIEANKLVSDPVSFDLHECLNSLVDMMEIQAQKKGVRLLCSVDPRIPSNLRGDKHYLKQVLINLLGNGIKFTEKGEVELRCMLAPSDTGAVGVEFSVRDTGIGIPLDQQSKILEPFEQAESSTSRRFGGTGLGTTIARDLVELMGGELSLESMPGKGSTFRFTLPMEQDDVLPLAGDQLPMAGRTVLSLIQDDDSAAIISSRLQEWSIDVLSARDVCQAEQLLQEASREYAPIAAIVLDERFMETKEFSLEHWHREALIADDVTVVISSIGGMGDALSLSADERVSPHLVWVKSEEELFNALHAARFPCYLGKDLFDEPAEEVRPLNILIADDNNTNCIILSSMLRNMGHSVIETDSGETFLEAVEAEDFDLALVDMHMPGMNGIETFQLYRFAHVAEEAIPFIVITADVTEATRNACRDAGIEHILSKPIDAGQLLVTIEQLTGGESRVSPEKKTAPVPAPVDETPMVDVGKVEEIMSLDTGTGLVARIMECFTEDAGNTIAQMRKTLKTRDYFNMKELAHALRGSAANVGLPQVQLAAGELEQMPEVQFMEMRLSQIDELEGLVQESSHQLSIKFGLKKPRPKLHVIN